MQKNATILIPDVSGYTELFSKTDLEFSTGVLCELLNELMGVAKNSYKVAEIEGDAILFYIKGRKVPAEELINYCLKAYTHFHSYLAKLLVRVEDPVVRGVIEQLTVKFIAHWGPIAEMNVVNFSKPVGLEIIKAHRLLKNSIQERAYILLTDAYVTGQYLRENHLLWPNVLQWQEGSEDYPVIGNVHYHYAVLSNGLAAKKSIDATD